MATQKQARQTLDEDGRIHNGLQCDASGGLRQGIKGRLTKKQVAVITAKNPNANIYESR